MCIVCTLFEKEKLTYNEALKAVREQASTDKEFTKDHLDDALDYLDSIELRRLNEGA